METFLLAMLFLGMISAPCMIAVISSKNFGREEDVEAITPAPEALPAPAPIPASLRQVAAEAEVEATLAQQRANQAHRAALMATARAAALRADVAKEVAAAADRAARNAARVAEAQISGTYLTENHPSLDFPRAKASRTRAA